MMKVSARALSVFCPHCQKRAPLESLRIVGSHPGRTLATCGDIVVEATASLNLSILANNVVIHGRVRGPVVANEIVDVGPTGQVIGDIRAVKIIVRDGATIQGRCEMSGPALPEPRPNRMPLGGGDPNEAEHVPPAGDPVVAPIPSRFAVVNAKPLRPPSARTKS